MKPSIETLRLLPGVMKSVPVKKWLPFSVLEKAATSPGVDIKSAGVPVGGIVEIQGPLGGGRTEVVLQFLKEHPKLKVGWIEEKFTFYPPVLAQYLVEWARVVFVEAHDQSEWSALRILQAQVFPIVVMVETEYSEVGFRKLQLAAERGGASVFWLHSGSVIVPQKWAISLSLRVREFKIEVL